MTRIYATCAEIRRLCARETFLASCLRLQAGRRIKSGELFVATNTKVSSLSEKANAGMTLSKEEVMRYSRHLIMPEVGMDGQLKLKQAKVLCIGTGGLGAPLGLYLAAAGVGRIG